MTTFYYKDVPSYLINSFVAVRDSFSNLENLLCVVNIINHCQVHREKNGLDFDIAILTSGINRILVKKNDGFFTMSFPFQLIDYGYNLSAHLDDYGITIDAAFISYMKNALETASSNVYCHDDIALSLNNSFGLEGLDCTIYADIFSHLLLKDHGYFRFDDDPVNENARIHPRYHFDFFCTNSSSVKLGHPNLINSDFFFDLFDVNKDRPYLS